MNSDALAQQLIADAEELGAAGAAKFCTDDLAFDPRTLLKCMYGCDEYGSKHMCPSRPNALRPWEFEKILRRYEWGLIIHTHEQTAAQEVALELERRAFYADRPFAISFSDCSLCDSCAGSEGLPCRNPTQARPSFHSIGIDVFCTARRFGFPIRVLQCEDEKEDWYSAVFVE